MITARDSQEAKFETVKESLTRGDLLTLSTLVNYSHRYFVVELSQSTIARLCTISRRTVIRSLSHLRELGWLKMRYRHEDTSQYFLSPEFLDQEFKPILQNVIFRRGFGLLKPWEFWKVRSRKPASGAVVTPLIIKEDINYKQSLVLVLKLAYAALVADRQERYRFRYDYEGPYPPNHFYTNYNTSIGTNTSDDKSAAQNYYLNQEDRAMKSLYEVTGLSPSNIEELSAYPEPVIDRALGALRKKGKVDFPFTYLRRVCEIFLEESKKKTDVSPATGIELFKPIQRREDLETGAIRMQAFRVTPAYKRADKLGFSPLTEGLACIWQHEKVDPAKIAAMIQLEMQYHAHGDKLCPLSKEMATQTINECPFYELAMQQKENNEVYSAGQSNTLGST